MELKKHSNRIWLEDEYGKEMAFVSFPQKSERIVSIASTVVDESLRGQGIADALLQALVQELRRTGRQAVPVCTYAVRWFARHPEYEDLLAGQAAHEREDQ